MEKRAIILVRVSSDGQADNYSPESQETACRGYATQVGMAVQAVFHEVFSGAAELDERPVLAEVSTALKSGAVHALIVYRLSRHTRAGGIHALLLAHECDRAGVELHYVEGTPRGRVDISNLVGQLTLLLAGDQAREERRALLEAMLRGRRARAQAGRPLAGGARCRYGWRFVDGVDPRTGKTVPKARCEIVEHEAAIIRRLFAEALAGKSTRSMTEGLMADGIPTPMGKRHWSHGSIAAILRDEKYAGVATAYTRPYTTPYSATSGYVWQGSVALPEDTYPAIIDHATWEAVQERLAHNQQASTRNNHAPNQTLLRGGHVICGICGRTMIALHRRGGGQAATPGRGSRGGVAPRVPVWNYVCFANPWNKERHRAAGNLPHPSIIAAELDHAAWQTVKRICTDPQVVERELRRLRADDGAALAKEVADRATLLEALADRERSYIQLAALAVDATQTREIQAQLSLLAEHRGKAEVQLAEAQARLARRHQGTARLEDTLAILRRLAPYLDRASYAERRELIYALNVKATVWPKGAPNRYKIDADLPDPQDETLLPVATTLWQTTAEDTAAAATPGQAPDTSAAPATPDTNCVGEYTYPSGHVE